MHLRRALHAAPYEDKSKEQRCVLFFGARVKSQRQMPQLF
jgi:hypothetical protein